MRRLFPLFLVALVGCKGDSKPELVGEWATGSSSIRFAQDGTYASTVGGLSVSGRWKMAGTSVVLTPTTSSGKPIAETMAQLQKSAPNLSPGTRRQAMNMIKDLGAARVLTLDSEGKALTSNEGTWTGMSLSKKP